jgi:plasmid stabilization system protein ParE
VADRFVTEVYRTLEQIEKFPVTGKRIPYVTGSARRLPVARFPYYVVFEEFADRIEILAIAHNRRRSGYWRG